MTEPSSTVRRRVQLGGVPAACAGAGALVGLVLVAATPHTYTATTTSFVSSRSSSRADLGADAVHQERAGDAYARVATTPLVLGSVISALGLETTPAQLAKRVVVDVPPDTALIRIRAADPSAAGAAALANAVQARLVAVAPSLAPQTSGRPALDMTAVEVAKVPLLPSSPDVVLDLAAGGLGGAALGLLVVVGLTVIRNRRPPSDGGPAPSML